VRDVDSLTNNSPPTVMWRFRADRWNGRHEPATRHYTLDTQKYLISVTESVNSASRGYE